MNNPSSKVKYHCKEQQRPWWKKVCLHRPRLDGLTLLCLLLIGAHAAVVLTGGVVAHQALYTQQLGLSYHGLMAGKLWQLVSYAFLHGSWFHLLTNVFMIWVIGGRLIVIVGQKRMLVTLLLGIVGGGILFTVFSAFTAPDRFVVGASGGAFGVFVLMAMLAPEVKVRPLPLTAKMMALGLLLVSFLLCLLNPEVGLIGGRSCGAAAGFFVDQVQLSTVFQIAHSCHLGGGLIGLWMSSRVMGKLVTLEQLQSQRLEG